MNSKFLLTIDEGTSSTRTIVYDHEVQTVASAQQEFTQHYPQPGWVEHDPEEIWQAISTVTANAMRSAGADAAGITGIGITNQRETTLVWDRQTGECVYNAIVWQDRRTAAICDTLRADGVEALVSELTGLRLDPYFSATKVGWILDNVTGARARAEKGELAFGTIDSFVLWRLTSGAVHATDATNASRTMLFNIHTQSWDAELLDIFDIPASMLPEVCDCAHEFGVADCDALGGSVPVLAIAGDQQAALIGQAGFDRGTVKSTYGTGCFVLANTAADPLASNNQLLTTVASRLGGKVSFGLEGSVFVAGSAVQWLRDQLKLIQSAAETEEIARATGVVDDVYVVPAFAGLGAPYWDPYARGAVVGLSRGSGREQIITATLQAIAYQTCDLIDAMIDDGIAPSIVRVDGGMVSNNWFLQFLADVLAIPVERPTNVESTALGATYLAGLTAGLFDSTDAIAARWRSERIFQPEMAASHRQELLQGWAAAVGRVGGHA